MGARRHSRWIDDEGGNAIREFAARAGVTPFIIFATALSALAHSGEDRQETALFGTLIAQRDRAEWRQVIGPLLNVSILAVSLGPEDSVAEAIRRTRDGALRAYRSRYFPFQELVSLLSPGRRGDESLFDVMVTMQPAPSELGFEGLAAELVEIDTVAAPYPLMIDIEPRGDAYRVSWTYMADRFDGCDVEQQASRLCAVVFDMVAGTDRTVRDVLRLLPSTSAARACP